MTKREWQRRNTYRRHPACLESKILFHHKIFTACRRTWLGAVAMRRRKLADKPANLLKVSV